MGTFSRMSICSDFLAKWQYPARHAARRGYHPGQETWSSNRAGPDVRAQIETDAARAARKDLSVVPQSAGAAEVSLYRLP